MDDDGSREMVSLVEQSQCMIEPSLPELMDTGGGSGLYQVEDVLMSSDEHMGIGSEYNLGGDNEEDDSVTPKIGMEFSTQEDAYNFYNKYALKMGFGIRWSTTYSSRKDKSKVIGRRIVCNKEGKRKLDEERQQTRETRVECKAVMKILLTESQTWKVGKFDSQHSHELSTPSKTSKHRSHKQLHRQKAVKNLVTQLHSEGISNANIAKVVNAFDPGEDRIITPQQVHDHLRVERKNNLGKSCAKIVQHFIKKKADDPTFYANIELTDDYTLRSVFWADGRSQESYKMFSDVIIFDVTYRTNNFSLPFAPFTGINHHRQSTLLGCALLADETEDTFVWLFEQWLACMGGKAPGAIITDQDAAIGNAIARVFPGTIHRFCDWNLDRNVGEHLIHLKATHGGDFETYFNRLRSSSTISEAESCWEELMARYTLGERSWLPRLWERRASWVPCYFRNTFLAGTRTTQRSESINAFFDTYVNASTPLHDFVIQYDKALMSRRTDEEDEDFKTMNSYPVITSGWPPEDQAGKIYTRSMFNIVKEEIKDGMLLWADKVSKEGTVTKFHVGRPQKDQSKLRTVTYDSDGVFVSCDCKYFEYAGYLCRHALCVLWTKRVCEIPDRYIMKRWTMDSRYRHVNTRLVDDVGSSKVDRNLYWGIRYKCNRALEEAYKSPIFAEEFDMILTKKLGEIDVVRLNERVDVPFQEDNQSNHMASNISSNSSPLFSIRDPTEIGRHKGRPKQPSRMRSGLEESQEQGKKRRKCGYCGEKGHYITGCAKAKAKDDTCNPQSL